MLANRRDVLAAQGRQIVEAGYSDIEKSFADGRTWALGERFSIVDAFFLVLHRWPSHWIANAG
ncbi:hypothetical protein IVA82_19310 [Bradyrhizobium sp. 142]|nr:hypothetical protein [Bradyrhizobium sp. 142]